MTTVPPASSEDTPHNFHNHRRRHGVVKRVVSWYTRWERPISSISLVSGFVFDALTLTRVDLFWDNLWVLVHFAMVALCILFISITDRMRARGKDPARIHFWLITIMQFFFGGLLSTFLVYYFRAGSIAVSWPFLAVLAAAFIANERLKQHYHRLVFQITLLFLCLFAFTIFIIPVLIHAMGPWVFILSGVVSVGIIVGFLFLLRAASHERFSQSRWALIASIAGVFAVVTALYFTNYIPPLPLSLTSGDIYQSLSVQGPGRYTVTAPSRSLWSFFEGYPSFTIATGTPLFAYTSIFAPPAFHLNIIHQWQHYSARTHAWDTVATVALRVSGGANNGYHTFSELHPSTPGKWRVNVKTTHGKVIGRINFSVLFGSSTLPLRTTHIN